MKKQSGASLIELLVGIVVTLIVMGAVAGTAQFLESNKRIAIGTNGVLETLALSYNEVSTDIKMAGLGIPNCPQVSYDSNGARGTLPLAINIESTATNSDKITSLYGDSATGNAYSRLTSDLASNSFTTGYAGHITNGESVLISSLASCDIYAVTAKSISGTVTSVSVRNADFANYPAGSAVTGLTTVKVVTQSVVNNTLQKFDSVSNTTYKVVDNVVALKAFYGLVDGSFVKSEGQWLAANLTAADRLKIRSIRVFLVARSPLRDTKCSSENPTSWWGGPTVDLSTLPDWKCYKYRTADFIVPFKNLSTGI